MPKIGYTGIADAKPPQPPKDGVHPLRILMATRTRSRAGKMMPEGMFAVEDDRDVRFAWFDVHQPWSPIGGRILVGKPRAART